MSMSVDSLKLVSERQHLVDVLRVENQYADIILKGRKSCQCNNKGDLSCRCGCFRKIHSDGGRL